MSLTIVQSLLLAGVSYVAWYILRPYVVKSSLANIPGPPSASWWKGNFHQVFDRDGWVFHKMLKERFGSVVRLNMLFGDQQLYVADPLALHNILIKEMYVYEEPDMFIDTARVVFGPSLFSTHGEQHRKQRKMLNPVFSIKHMRALIPIFYPIAHQLSAILEKKIRLGEANEINILGWMSRAALQYIGVGGMGYSFDALDESAKNDYSDAVKLFSPTNFKLILHRQFLPYLKSIGTPSFQRLVLAMTPSDKVQTMLRIVDIMWGTSLSIYKKKKIAMSEGDEAVLNQIGSGKDIMSVLMRANLAAEKEDRLSEEELIGQMSVFIFAGHDTTSGALSRTLHQLALNPDVQEKLRQEIRTARAEKGDLDYDSLMALPYLDAVCRETLRVFPPVPQLLRTCRKDTVLPLAWPITSVDGTQITEIPVKKNTGFVLSIVAINRNEKIWGPDASQWKPERWLHPLPESVQNAKVPGVYSNSMTFSAGGRACIGFKFAEMELKLVLTILLDKFAFAPCEKQVFWAMSFLQSPVIKGSKSLKPELPIKMSLAA